MSKLNTICQEKNDLQDEVTDLQHRLLSTEARCVDLNKSFKDKSVACCELEDQLGADVISLTADLEECQAENRRLRERVRLDLDVEVIMRESEERIAGLTSDRRHLTTSIEVLEADIRCLRGELRRAESKARQRKSSTSSCGLQAELAAAEADSNIIDVQPPLQLHTVSPPASPSTSLPSQRPTPPSEAPPLTFQRVLMIGDSHMRYSTNKCVENGAFVECCPGGKIVDIKNKLLCYLSVSLDLIYFHVGCNNLKRGYRGGPGYNGGHGKRGALHSMADLLYTARTQFPNSKIVLNSVLIRRDIDYRSLHNFNLQLELMCDNFGVTFVEANCRVSRRDLVPDGVHFNRRAVSRLGILFVEVINFVLQSLSPPKCDRYDAGPSVPSSSYGLDLGTGGVTDTSHDHGGCGHRESSGTMLPGNLL